QSLHESFPTRRSSDLWAHAHAAKKPFPIGRRWRRAVRMTEKPTRIEKDSMGEMLVPADALHGASTHRAVVNFPVSGYRFSRPFIDRKSTRLNSSHDQI